MVTREHVAQWLIDYSLPASAVCLVADIPDPALSLWLRAKKELTPTQLDRLEEALGVCANICHDSFAPVNWRSQAILPVVEKYRAARRQYVIDTAAFEALHASSGE
jgi:hypothetical protein